MYFLHGVLVVSPKRVVRIVERKRFKHFQRVCRKNFSIFYTITTPPPHPRQYLSSPRRRVTLERVIDDTKIKNLNKSLRDCLWKVQGTKKKIKKN